MSDEKCQRCGEVGEDRRTLWMACMYQMEELGLPLVQVQLWSGPSSGHAFYTMRVCKSCRADWMGAIKKWFEPMPAIKSCGSGIFIRRNGATVEITEEEWNQLNPGRAPVKLAQDES